MKYILLLLNFFLPISGMLVPRIDEDMPLYEKDIPLTLAGHALKKIRKEDPWLSEASC